MLHSIGFCIPTEKVLVNPPKKTKILSIIQPTNTAINRIYNFDNEEDYYKEYQSSYFALTKPKAGWDCMRHYEIMANRCIPLFEYIDDCPEGIMTFVPKKLFIQAWNLYEEFKNKNIEDLTVLQIVKYNILEHKIYTVLCKHLTCDNMAKYLVTTSGFKWDSNLKILFLGGDKEIYKLADYQRDLLLIGLKQIYKKDCHDFPKINCIYKSDKSTKDELYGRGFSYSKIIDDVDHDEEHNKYIIQNIENKYYDFIIFGSITRGALLYSKVMYHYEPNKVICVIGEDMNTQEQYLPLVNQILQNNNHLFLRENNIILKK